MRPCHVRVFGLNSFIFLHAFVHVQNHFIFPYFIFLDDSTLALTPALAGSNMTCPARLFGQKWGLNYCKSVFLTRHATSSFFMHVVSLKICSSLFPLYMLHIIFIIYYCVLRWQRCSKTAAKTQPVVVDVPSQSENTDHPAVFIRPRGHLLLTPSIPSTKDHAKIIAALLQTPQVSMTLEYTGRTMCKFNHWTNCIFLYT